MPTSVTLAAIVLLPVPPLHRLLIQSALAWLLTLLLRNLVLPLRATRPMRRKTKEVVSRLPFGPQTWRLSVSGANLPGIALHHARPPSLAARNTPFLSNGEEAISSPRTTLLPDIIENKLLNETSSGRMSGPFSVEEAHVIFNGHFRTSPVGLVEKVPGDGNWRMIRHLSKTDHLGFSTNDALDSHDFPTLFFSAAHVAELVRVSPITVLFAHSLA